MDEFTQLTGTEVNKLTKSELLEIVKSIRRDSDSQRGSISDDVPAPLTEEKLICILDDRLKKLETDLFKSLTKEIDQLQEVIRGLRESQMEKDAKICRLERRMIAMEEASNSREIAAQDRDAADRKDEMVIWKTKEIIKKDPTPKDIIQGIKNCNVRIDEFDINEVYDKRGESGKGPIIVKFNNFSKKLELLKVRSRENIFRNSLSKEMQDLKRRAFILKERQKIFKFWEFKGVLYYQLSEEGRRVRATELSFMQMEFSTDKALPLFDLRK